MLQFYSTQVDTATRPIPRRITLSRNRAFEIGCGGGTAAFRRKGPRFPDYSYRLIMSTSGGSLDFILLRRPKQADFHCSTPAFQRLLTRAYAYGLGRVAVTVAAIEASYLASKTGINSATIYHTTELLLSLIGGDMPGK